MRKPGNFFPISLALNIFFRQFVKEFIRHAHSRGLTEAGDQSQVDHYDDLSMYVDVDITVFQNSADIFREKISNRFRVYTRNNCMFVIFIAPGKKRAYPGDIHHVMKKMEQEHSRIFKEYAIFIHQAS